MMSTSGEVFASPMMLSFINSINKTDFPNVSLKIQTNGLLSKARWHRLNKLPVKKVTITIDASTKPVYEQLRRGGIWEDLLDNLSFLQAQKKETGMQLHTRMVVQADNYHQMLDFYNLSKQYSADVVEYGRILPWGHLQDAEQFLLLDIANPENTNHDKFLKSFAKLGHLTDVMTFGGLPH
jgi:MoaA/NifB/PqqE/SkfB family radical SAM enzyme